MKDAAPCMDNSGRGTRRVSVQIGAAYLIDVAQTSKSAVSRVSKPAGHTKVEPIWKSAIQQVWKPALRNIGRLVLLAAALAQVARAQNEEDYPRLPRARYHSGQDVLNAFAPVSKQMSNSVVELNVNEDTVALGAVVESNGLVLTKASELKAGKLTCWLASGKEVEAQLLAVDDDDDVALVRVKADGLKPILWAVGQVVEGQWAITPGLADTPQAVGIISTMPHKIRPQRALMGVAWDRFATNPIVSSLEPGFGAEKAGIKPGDIIVAVDGASVTNWTQVFDILGEFRDGQSVRIRYQREEKEFEASIELMTPKPGQDAYRSYSNERETRLSGDVSLRSEGFDQAIEHDTVLEPWQCGGPLVNLDGKAIGLNIARASRFATYALPASLARQILARLKSKAEKP
jgi:serine protease Do